MNTVSRASRRVRATNIHSLKEPVSVNRSRFRTHFVLVALVFILAACSNGSSGGAAASSQAAATEAATDAPPDAGGEQAEARIVSSTFEPAELTVSVGTEVVFINDDSFPHTITEGTDGGAVENPIVDEEIAGNGAEVRVMFDEAGTFDITCEIHPSMQMTVTVEG